MFLCLSRNTTQLNKCLQCVCESVARLWAPLRKKEAWNTILKSGSVVVGFGQPCSSPQQLPEDQRRTFTAQQAKLKHNPCPGRPRTWYQLSYVFPYLITLDYVLHVDDKLKRKENKNTRVDSLDVFNICFNRDSFHFVSWFQLCVVIKRSYGYLHLTNSIMSVYWLLHYLFVNFILFVLTEGTQ